MHQQPPSQKSKKLRSLAALATNFNTRNMVMEIVEMQEGKNQDLVLGDFKFKTHGIGPPSYETMVNMWKYTNVRIKD